MVILRHLKLCMTLNKTNSTNVGQDWLKQALLELAISIRIIKQVLNGRLKQTTMSC